MYLSSARNALDSSKIKFVTEKIYNYSLNLFITNYETLYAIFLNDLTNKLLYILLNFYFFSDNIN